MGKLSSLSREPHFLGNDVATPVIPSPLLCTQRVPVTPVLDRRPMGSYKTPPTPVNFLSLFLHTTTNKSISNSNFKSQSTNSSHTLSHSNNTPPPQIQTQIWQREINKPRFTSRARRMILSSSSKMSRLPTSGRQTRPSLSLKSLVLSEFSLPTSELAPSEVSHAPDCYPSLVITRHD